MPTTNHYAELFLADTPMMDVRAPVEFLKGAFPSATNLPLMTDAEREAVGTCYKAQGQAAAIALGHELVNGETKQARVERWVEFAKTHPQGVLYCFRGGMRSRISQQWLQEAGIELPFVEGGYKAMRQFLLNQLHERIEQGQIYILAGATGSGKTEVIEQWPHSVDLEKLANHRGSAFGNTGSDQPSQIDFENRWSIDWLKRTQQSSRPVLFEDESRLIGRIAVLPEFLAQAKQAPIVLLKAPMAERVARIRRDYFVNAYQQRLPDGEEVALAHLDQFIRGALSRIQKRLGGERYMVLLALLDRGLVELQSRSANWSHFDELIEQLLSHYYDPMYRYQYSQKRHQQIFEGNHMEIRQWLTQQAG